MNSVPNDTLISVVGTHAGETLKQIFKRKRKEIEKAGFTFWLYKSHSAKPKTIQKLAKNNKETLCFFVKASSRTGARPTKDKELSTHFSVDGVRWQKIPKNILVTGSSKSAFALVLKDIKLVKNSIDLWHYSDFNNQKEPVKIRLGDSTLLITQKDSSKHPNKMKSHIREVVAIAKLKAPFCVQLTTKPSLSLFN